jgi:hypothetical protein
MQKLNFCIAPQEEQDLFQLTVDFSCNNNHTNFSEWTNVLCKQKQAFAQSV